MAAHLENLEKILTFILMETPAQIMIDTLYKKIRCMVEKHILLRDMENFVAYFRYFIFALHTQKSLRLEPKLVQAFIGHTYNRSTNPAQEHRANKLYEYVRNKIGEGLEINNENLKLLDETLEQEKEPSFEKLMEHARVAMILKWLQGPLKDQISKELKDYVIFLATIYGQYKTSSVFDVEWHTYEVQEKDIIILIQAYRLFEIAIVEAIQVLRVANAKNPNPNNYHEEFRVVFKSLENLIKAGKKAKLDVIDLFKDKIIASAALIYLQDDFVKKDAELKKLIQLLVSLYYRFRDKRYATVTH